MLQQRLHDKLCKMLEHMQNRGWLATSTTLRGLGHCADNVAAQVVAELRGRYHAHPVGHTAAIHHIPVQWSRQRGRTTASVRRQFRKVRQFRLSPANRS